MQNPWKKVKAFFKSLDAHEKLRVQYIQLRKEYEALASPNLKLEYEQLKKEHTELRARHDKLVYEHDFCLRYTKETMKSILDQRDELLSKFNAKVKV